MNGALKQMTRKQAKRLLAAEARRRRTGDWGPWERRTWPHNTNHQGFLKDVSHAMVNRVFSVLIRDCGCTFHLAVSSLSERRPTWHEMQRIKDELCGPDFTAVEVYPPRSEIVDDANMFHLWIVNPLPFSLHDERHRQDVNMNTGHHYVEQVLDASAWRRNPRKQDAAQ